MKSIFHNVRVLSLTFCFTLNLARATVFNFSYNFGDGVTASGSLTGTQNGQFVTGISAVSLSFNGTTVPGSIFTSTYDAGTFSYLNGPVVSFAALQNNFVFSNSNLVNGDFGYDSLFYILKPSVQDPSTAVGLSNPLGVFGSQNDPTVAGRWSLQAATSGSVPDSGATAVLFGAALVGLAALRRKLN